MYAAQAIPPIDAEIADKRVIYGRKLANEPEYHYETFKKMDAVFFDVALSTKTLKFTL